MGITRSSIVVSTAGRDKDKLFFAVELDGEYALIADGKARRLGQPKRKKLKHLRFVSQSDSRVAEKIRTGDKVLDSEIRRALAAFRQEFEGQLPRGGN